MDRALLGEIRRMLDPIARKLKLVASKAIIELVKDAPGVQMVQASVLKGEVTDDSTEHMQPGGLTHVPFPGAEGIYLSVGGVRDDGVMICVSDRRYRPKDKKPGETLLYNEGDLQSTIYLREDGSIEVSAHTSGDVPSKITMRANGECELYASLGNDPSIVLLKADGAIEVTAGGGGNKSTATFGADSSITLKNDEGSFQMAQNGNVTINGVVIDVDGNVTAPAEITAMAASPATSVTLSQHLHVTGTGPSLAPTPGT
jgi:phage gp45-like